MSQVSMEVVFGQVQQSIKTKKYYGALRQLLSISLQYSKNITFLSYLSETQLALQDFAGLIKTQLELIRQRGSIKDQFNLMRSYYKMNKRNEALDIGLQIQAQNQELSDPLECELSHILTKIYLEENDFEGAAEAILKAKFSESDDFLLWAQGVVYLNNDQKFQALEYFRRAVQMNARNDQAWVSLGLMHKEMGDEDLYLANIEKAIDLNPFNASALKQISLSVTRNKEKANSAFERVRFYLSEYCFDEDISMCHIQMLSQVKHWSLAALEIDKLMFHQPENQIFQNIKKAICAEQNI